MPFEIDRKTRLFMDRLLRRTQFDVDPDVQSASISKNGLLINYNDDIRPEAPIELWATFDQNLYRRSSVNPDDFTARFSLSKLGTIVGNQFGMEVGAETELEARFVLRVPQWCISSFCLRKDWK